jgi:phage baseplate assembly protein W
MPYKSIELNNASAVPAATPSKVQFYKGFSTIDAGNPTSRLFDLSLIKQNIINTFSTRRGERVMNPSFGSIIWDVLMEPMTPSLKETLNADIQKICSSDPRAVPVDIKLIEFSSGYIVEVTMKLVGFDVSSQMTLTFDQTIGLTVQ